MIQEAKQLVSHENLNLMQDEEYRHFCRKSSFQRGDLYESVRISKAGRNEFILVQAAKVKTDCNFQLTAVSNSNEQIVINNIFPTDHLYQNVMLLVACSKLLRQENYFRVWYHAGGILRRKPHDQSEGLKYVQIEPEPKCAARKGKRTNHTFVHFTLLRMRLPITNNTEQIWRRIGNATDMQQPRFRSYAMLSKYQQSIFVPDSFIGKHSSIVASSYYLALFIVISFITSTVNSYVAVLSEQSTKWSYITL
uniref:MSP domain-containing protein n=1 Tax=Elaeophora elaphi TaxID=1147741 RepID=A0A0R3S2I0_9BILA